MHADGVGFLKLVFYLFKLKETKKSHGTCQYQSSNKCHFWVDSNQQECFFTQEKNFLPKQKTTISFVLDKTRVQIS